MESFEFKTKGRMRLDHRPSVKKSGEMWHNPKPASSNKSPTSLELCFDNKKTNSLEGLLRVGKAILLDVLRLMKSEITHYRGDSASGKT